jgi:hypothetical protein
VNPQEKEDKKRQREAEKLAKANEKEAEKARKVRLIKAGLCA